MEMKRVVGACVVCLLAVGAIVTILRLNPGVQQVSTSGSVPVAPSNVAHVDTKEETNAAPDETRINQTTAKSWQCCVNKFSVNDLHNHPTAQQAQDVHHDYACPDNPSNFSWYYGSSPHHFERHKWRQISIAFVGGSTTRQMYEQFKWEMPHAHSQSHHNYNARLLFEHIEVGGCCNYDRSHILDTRSLHHELLDNLKQAPDFLVFNVGTWWATRAIGTVIDQDGTHWRIEGPVHEEWAVANETISQEDKPDFTFATLMERAIRMMMDAKDPKTTLVWRSEGTTDCPVATTFRGSVGPVLQRMNVPVLNISQATCDYLDLREHYDSDHKGPHLCFPSVALRHWLLQFQQQFL